MTPISPASTPQRKNTLLNYGRRKMRLSSIRPSIGSEPDREAKEPRMDTNGHEYRRGRREFRIGANSNSIAASRVKAFSPFVFIRVHSWFRPDARTVQLLTFNALVFQFTAH